MWQTVVGIDIMVLEQVPAVNWMGNWFSSRCREWLKPIGQLVDWSVSNTKPFIPWGTHTFHEWSSTLLHFISLVIKCLLTNFTLLLWTFYMMAIRSTSLHACLGGVGPIYIYTIDLWTWLFPRVYWWNDSLITDLYVKLISQQVSELCHFESDKELSGHLYLVMIAMLSVWSTHSIQM